MKPGHGIQTEHQDIELHGMFGKRPVLQFCNGGFVSVYASHDVLPGELVFGFTFNMEKIMFQRYLAIVRCEFDRPSFRRCKVVEPVEVSD